MTTNTDSLTSPEHRQLLLDMAANSIKHGLETGNSLPVSIEDYPEALREKRATFVTLHINNNLRGCIGMLEAVRPLLEDVVENAFAAAFRDPRFAPVSESEFKLLDIHISILSPPTPMQFTSEQDLLSQIRPGIDGLIIEEGLHKGTFLPSVWESLPDPSEFLAHLKQKAGMSPHHWSDALKLYRYTTESFPDE